MTLNEVGGVALYGKKMMMHMTLNEVVWQENDDANMTFKEVGGVSLYGKKMMTLNKVVRQENSGQSFYWQLTPPHPFSC